MASLKSRRTTIVCVLTFEVILIILFAIFTKYHYNADSLTPSSQVDHDHLDDAYPMFQDIHVMIFVGFGFLMTFLKKYGFSAVGFNFLIASLAIQWAILCSGFFRLEHEDGKIHINISNLINADIASAAVLISFGAVLGKTSPLQLILMAIIEIVIFAANEYLGTEVLQAADAGGSMYVHAFGAYFGLAVSFVLSHGVGTKTEGNNLESSSYNSDISSMIGTIFLWLFWPSFNAALVDGDEKHRAVINTYLSLAACCIVTFAISSLFNKKTKFEMVHIQNATLAGGVCVGTSANMMIQPYGALIIGCFAGFLSTIGFQFIQGCMLRRLRIHDTCGVHNLHGMPGFAAGLIGALMAGLADYTVYGPSLHRVFPARGPGSNRSAGIQAAYQLLALTITLIIAIAGGLFTGLILRHAERKKVEPEHHFDDAIWWKSEEDEEEDEEKGESNAARE